MNNDSKVREDHQPGSAASAQTYARIAGVLFLLTIVTGGFGEAYVPSRLVVSGDATATANNIHALGSLFRWGFAAYLVEAMGDIALALIFYALLRPVQKDLSLLAAFFGLLSTALFAVAEFFYFAASHILGGANYLKSFSPDQLNTMALLSLKLYGLGAGIFMAFYGIGWVIRGYLIIRSSYFPKILGVLLVVGGLGFMAKNFTLVLAPGYASDFLLLPMFVAGVPLMVWLLVKGVDVAKWEAKAATSKRPT